MFDQTDLVLADRIVNNFDRILSILELWAKRPPVVIAMSQAPQPAVEEEPHEFDVDQKPKTIDGKTYRHRLMSGGWLIETLADDGPTTFAYEDLSKRRYEMNLRRRQE